MAFAVDWPGWSRGAKSPESALETLESYRERYRPIAVAARRADEFDAAGRLDVVEDRVGPGSTDFWGISFSPSALEREPMDDAELEGTSWRWARPRPDHPPHRPYGERGVPEAAGAAGAGGWCARAAGAA